MKRLCLVLLVAVGPGLAGATGGAVAQDRAAFLAGTAKDCPGCDLRGASLDRRDISGADLSDANLRGATFSRQGRCHSRVVSKMPKMESGSKAAIKAKEKTRP